MYVIITHTFCGIDSKNSLSGFERSFAKQQQSSRMMYLIRVLVVQVFRCIGVAMTGRMVSDILSRLVETVAEQGEDMQVMLITY